MQLREYAACRQFGRFGQEDEADAGWHGMLSDERFATRQEKCDCLGPFVTCRGQVAMRVVLAL